MNLYVHKDEDGNINPPAPLPRRFGNVTNFCFADGEILNKHGWFIYSGEEQPAYDERTQYLIENFVIEGNVGRSDYEIKTRSAAEQEEYDKMIEDRLEAAKRFALFNLIDIVDTVRNQHTTGGSSQAQVYAEKAAEAQAYIDAGSPTDPNVADDYPYLKVDSIVYDISIEAAANNILEARNSWMRESVLIEENRLACKNRIKAATSVEEVKAAFADGTEKITAVLNEPVRHDLTIE